MRDRLTLDQMNILVQIADAGSFSAAARRLGRAQSAISQAIATMEAALQLQLFDRSGNIPTLTEAGKIIIASARHVLSGADQLRSKAQAIKGGVEAEIRIATDTALPRDVFMESLLGLQKKFPSVQVTIISDGARDAMNHIRTQTAHLAFSPLVSDTTPEIVRQILTEITMVPVAAANHEITKEAEPITKERLERYTILRLSPKSMYSPTTVINEWLFTNHQTRLEFILSGLGWGIVPFHDAKPLIDEGKLKLLKLVEFSHHVLPLHVSYSQSYQLGPAATWFIDDLRERLAKKFGNVFDI